jgi:hypothetical protein
MRPPPLLRVFIVTLMRIKHFISQLSHLLQLILPDLVLHLLPPIRIVPLLQSLLYTLIQRTAMQLIQLHLLLTAPDDLMVLCTLLENNIFPRLSELLSSNKVTLNIRIRYFSSELIVFSNELINLSVNSRKILKLKLLIAFLLATWRHAFLIVFIDLLPFRGSWHCTQIDDGQVYILQKQTR